MRARNIAKSLIRIVLSLLLAVVLLATGVILTLYSAWGQRLLKQTLVEKLNTSPDDTFVIKDFRLRFPLKLSLQGLTIVQRGDTMVMADTLNAHVAVLPLLLGRVHVDDATLVNGFYQLGAPDSAMWLRLKAERILLHPATVMLGDMHITLDEGLLQHASVDLSINPDTTAATSADTTASQSMLIRLKHLRVDDLTYRMRMLPTIDSLGTNISTGSLVDGQIDLGAQCVKLHAFNAVRLSAAYIAPDSATIAATPVVPVDPDAPVSPPWTVTIDTIRITDSQALYTTRGVVPLPGLDFGYIEASAMDMTVTDFYNQATILSLPLDLHATERCGVTLDATGTFAMDSANMYFRDFNVTTPQTHLYADGLMGAGDLLTAPDLPLRLKAGGYCGLADLQMMFPDFAPYIKPLSPAADINLAVDIDGTTASLDIADASLSVNGRASLHAKGNVQYVFDPDRLGADLRLNGRILNLSSLVKAITSPDLALVVPPMSLSGAFSMHRGDMSGNLTANALDGRVALDANLKGSTEAYEVEIDADRFPLHAFMPDMGLGNATLNFVAKGAGFDVFDARTEMYATAHVASLVYNGYDYRDIYMKADLHGGHAWVDGSIESENIDAQVQAEGNLSGASYDWTANVDGRSIDLHALKLSETPMFISGSIEADATYTPSSGHIDATIHLPGLYYKGQDEHEVSISNVTARFLVDDSLTRLDLHNRDLIANASVTARLDSLTGSMHRIMAVIDQQISDRKINVDTLQRVLPEFEVNVVAGADNLINDILRPSRMSISHLSIDASNHSELAFNSSIYNYSTGAMRLDTLALHINQQADKMHLVGTLNNVPGNMDNWAHIRLDGLLNTDRLSVRIIQQDVKMQTGFDLGAIAVVADSAVTARLFPLSPVIGYKKWSVNLDNFLYYNFFTRHIDANLKMRGADSSVQLYTEHDHTRDYDIEHDNDSINNVVLNISDIHLADWISFNPFAPPISGNLSANINLNWDGGTNINGAGQVQLSDFYYDRRKVASMLVDLDVSTNLAGTVRAQAALSVDGERTITLAGNLNDESATSPFDLDFSMINFPLATLNPFLPDDVVQLYGTLNGEMQITGDTEHPLITGEISFDSAYAKVAMTNTSYAFSTVKIPVVDNLVSFSDFSISGANEHPLTINGTVDIKELTSPKIDLKLNADNMMVVNTQRAAKNALIYGKAYIGLDASVKGNMRFMAVNAKVDVLSGTNVTYKLTESAESFTNSSTHDMVKFVNLSDTAAVAAADSLVSESMLMMVDAQLNIQQGTSVTVDLFTGARDKVQIQPTGYLTYSQSPLADGRLTGRIDLNSGYVRYTLPVIGSEKTFTFTPDSYVTFNGDMLNPGLNIHANELTKVNVTQEGQNSRLVNFDIKVNITGSLDRMDVSFDLSTDDDLAVANELQAMSPEQRANQAMNMLLYNMYTGPGSSADINLTANPLFSFLESQINTWAANNIKGVDLSFGIDQYNQRINGANSSAMSYSYQVSKTLFNDRFKIVVGGNYTTDSNADENLAENLINDISFEYYLNKQQTMLIRLFRHVGYVSILEGEITQTGVGFVYRRKLDRLVNMLPKIIRPKERRY